MLVKILPSNNVPQENFLNIMADGAGRLVIKVLDVQGRMAKKLNTMINEGSQCLCIDTQDLPTGKYVLNAFCGDSFLKSLHFTKG